MEVAIAGARRHRQAAAPAGEDPIGEPLATAPG
jgi:hypothetical protein